MPKILLTGIAGFIGAHTARALLDKGTDVVGIDNFNDYYDVQLKKDRLLTLAKNAAVSNVDLTDLKGLEEIFRRHKFDQVCHLAAQAGVSYSLKNPVAYEMSNNLGTLHVFELSRKYGVPSVIFASSSSVYGNNKKIPFSVNDNVDHPISLYAATKKSNELMAHTYHHLYGIRMTGLRFFTVYGPWGRPDMALFKFTKAILGGRPIDVYNHGKMKRDFTYISDIVAGILSAMERNYPYEIFNLGNSDTVDLLRFISVIEQRLNRKAVKNMLPLQPGDVPETFADIDASIGKLGFKPTVKIEEGIGRFIDWYKTYYKTAS